MPGGRLLGAETQRNMSNLWFKKWSQSLRNSASGRLREVVAVRVLTVFGIATTNKSKSYVWYEYEITWSSGQCSLKLFFRLLFCNWLIFHVFRFGVPKPTLMVCLITLVVISFRFCINISKLNILLWAAVLWLSCCNCCVDRLLLLWLSALKKFAAFAKSLYSLQSTT